MVAVVASEKSLFERLKKEFKTEEIHPYGSVIVVSEVLWHPHWTEKLQSEGCKVFKQNVHGKIKYFVKLENQQPEHTLENQKQQEQDLESQQQPENYWGAFYSRKILTDRLEFFGSSGESIAQYSVTHR